MALALHAGALVAVAIWQSRAELSPPGEQEITIDFAPPMENLVSVAPAEVQAIESPPTEVETQPVEAPTEAVPVEEQVEEAPQEVVEATEVEAVPVEETIAPDAVPALDPKEAVIAQPLEEKPKPKPVKPAPKKEERKPDPKPRRAAAERAPPPSNASQGQASASRENMQGSAASADPNVLNRYVASLAASLRSRLRYPDRARSQGVTGVATVRFSMDRSGQILSASLVRSAGDASLDAAALAAARPGSSLPAAPAALPQQQFTFSVPLQFNLRR
ncbi:protein TonB [Microvirga guangxiensis]|uniref:Protein TonB n=2 Tax=Microvirga guangxiensis TaxID=549386 RepID=A0A1G5ED89_9HYPH|nr:protein TonB [Microvirga guangxiensis]